MAERLVERRGPPWKAPPVIAIGAAIIVVGLVWRLLGIHGSLWLDEFSTLWSVEAGFLDVFRRAPTVMQQSPAYYVLPWVSLRILSETELALRLPSLVAVAGATVVLAITGAKIGRRKAAWWTTAFFWLSYPAIWASVNARPYGLAMLCAATAILGFLTACRSGAVWGRVCWILGAAGLIWSHYLLSPMLGGLALVYMVRAPLRRRYSRRQMGWDAMLVLVLVAPALPHLLDLLRHRDASRWMEVEQPLGVLAVLLPFTLAALFPTHRRDWSPETRAERDALAASVLVLVASLMVLGALGLSAVNARYASVLVVPASLLAGWETARLKGLDWIAPAAFFAVTTALGLCATYLICGSFSGAGYQEWRQAVSALRQDLTSSPDAPVLFRSGNAEDDLTPPGELRWPATLAPLRSPGETAPAWNIVLLTYRWEREGRAAYFAGPVAQRIEGAQRFYLLCLASTEPGANGYCPNVEAWVGETWPGRFVETRFGPFRQLSAIRFDRKQAE